MGTNTKSAVRVMDAARRLVRALAGSARAVETRSGISGAQMFILTQLGGMDRPCSVNELAELTLTHQSTVSGVVTRLVERRLVKRTTSPDDARRVDIELTARGRALLADASPTLQAQLVNSLARLSPSECAALADALDAWLEGAGLGSHPAPLFFEIDMGGAERE